MRGPEGSAAAEFALVLPVLALLLFGTIEVGRALHDYQLVDKSVRSATRYLSRAPVSCPAGFDVLDEANARNLALTGTVDGSGDYLLKYWTQPSTIIIPNPCLTPIDNSANTWRGAFDGAAEFYRATIIAQVPIFLEFGSSWLGNMSVDVVVRHEEVVFGE